MQNSISYQLLQFLVGACSWTETCQRQKLSFEIEFIGWETSAGVPVCGSVENKLKTAEIFLEHAQHV